MGNLKNKTGGGVQNLGGKFKFWKDLVVPNCWPNGVGGKGSFHFKIVPSFIQGLGNFEFSIFPIIKLDEMVLININFGRGFS